MDFFHFKHSSPNGEIFKNKTWNGLNKGDPGCRLWYPKGRRWATPMALRSIWQEAPGRVMKLLHNYWSWDNGKVSLPRQVEIGTQLANDLISGQRLGTGIPKFLVQSYTTGTRCMLAHSFQYSILNRSYQKTETGEHGSSQPFPHILPYTSLPSACSRVIYPFIINHLRLSIFQLWTLRSFKPPQWKT